MLHHSFRLRDTLNSFRVLRTDPATPSLSCSAAARLVETVKGAFDRSNPTVKAYQDLAVNVGVFALAVVLINRYGHKLAV